jgi:hypothetical protein
MYVYVYVFVCNSINIAKRSRVKMSQTTFNLLLDFETRFHYYGNPGRQPEKVHEGEPVKSNAAGILLDAIAHNQPDVPTTYFGLSISDSKTGTWKNHTFPLHKRDELISLAQDADENQKDVYIRTTLLKDQLRGNQRGTKALTHGTSVLWVDLDINPDKGLHNIDDLKMAAKEVDPAPSIVVQSGNGLHVYWCLREPLTDIYEIERKTRALAKDLKGDSGWAVGKVLRLPGTHNYKDLDNPNEVDLLWTTPPKGKRKGLKRYSSERFRNEEIKLPEDLSIQPSPVDFTTRLKDLPPQTRSQITSSLGAIKRKEDASKVDRSKNDWSVVCELLKRNWKPGEILYLMTDGPEGWPITQKTMSDGTAYAVHTISSAIQEPPDESPTPTPTDFTIDLNKERGLKALVDQLTTYTDEKTNAVKPKRITLPDEELIYPLREALKKANAEFVQDDDSDSRYLLLPNGESFEVSLTARSRYSLWLTMMAGRTPRTPIHDNLIHLLAPTHGLREIELVGWSHFDPDTLTFSVLSDLDGTVIYAPPNEEPTLQPNGKAEVLHRRPKDPLPPIEWDPTVDVKKVFDKFFCRFTSNLATSDIGLEVLEAYTLAIPMMRGLAPLLQTIPILHLRGAAGSGKTQALKLINTIIFGDPNPSQPTEASVYREGQSGIFVPFDDYDNMEMATKKLFLTASTGITRKMAAQGSDTGTVHQRVHLPFAVTSTTELADSTLRRRALVIQISQSQYPTKNFTEECWLDLLDLRNDFWSAYILWVANKVAPDLPGVLRKYSQRIRNLFDDSSFKPLAPSLALLYRLLEVHPNEEFRPKNLEETINEWIVEFDITAAEMATTKPILEAIQLAFDRYNIHSDSFQQRDEKTKRFLLTDRKKIGLACDCGFNDEGSEITLIEGTATKWITTLDYASKGAHKYSTRTFTPAMKDIVRESINSDLASNKPYRVGPYLITKLENWTMKNLQGWRVEIVVEGD